MPSVHDRFTLVTDFDLAGDQARAIDELVDGLERGDQHQVLLGVTGSGKTFTMAQVIARVNRPTLVMAHNKTLAAQLYQEFRRFFPHNAVEYFVSYYDYYQPEAYVPATDSYIEKEATINDEIDRLRLSATRSLFERRDVIIVASVSCIYGLGSPEAYYGMLLPLERGADDRPRDAAAQAGRDPVRAQRPRLQPRHLPGPRRRHRGLSRRTRTSALRIELFGDEVDALSSFDPLTGKVLQAARAPGHLSEVALRRRRESRRRAAVETHQGGTRRADARPGRRRASCSRRSGCTSGPCSTSR